MIIHVRKSHPQPWHTVTVVTFVGGAGECLTPVTVTVGQDSPVEMRVKVACSRRLVRHEQCRNCRHRVFATYDLGDGNGDSPVIELPAYRGF